MEGWVVRWVLREGVVEGTWWMEGGEVDMVCVCRCRRFHPFLVLASSPNIHTVEVTIFDPTRRLLLFAFPQV